MGVGVRLDIYYGDPGEYQPIDRVKFVELTTTNGAGQRISFIHDIDKVAGNSAKLATASLRLGDFADGTYVVSGRYDNGFYVHDTENRAVATTLEWKSDVIDSAHYLKFAKSLFFVDKPSAGYDRILGHAVEFVPQSDPFSLKAGASLPVLLLANGKPLPGYKVDIGDDTDAAKLPGSRTDANGIVKVPLDHTGYYRLSVDFRQKSRYPELYEFDDVTASLVFLRR